MSLPSSAFLTIPLSTREKDDPSHVLARVEHFTANLSITLTEGTFSYKKQMTENEISSLVSKARPLWHESFKRLLLGVDVSGKSSLELVATRSNGTITILVREIADTPLKVCTFEVERSDEVEISLFTWSVELAQRLRREHQMRSTAESHLQEEIATTKDAKLQLQNILSTSQRHEEAILSSFCKLLNSKKELIRQLRIETSRSEVSKKPRTLHSSDGRQPENKFEPLSKTRLDSESSDIVPQVLEDDERESVQSHSSDGEQDIEEDEEL